MADKTGISWASATWNPLRARHRKTSRTGWACVRVSDGCLHCYAATLNRTQRWDRGTGEDYTVPALDRVETYLAEHTLLQPLRWRKPRRVFVASMTDLFGDWVSDQDLARIWAVMAASPQHQYQVLTKRPERMRDYCEWIKATSGDSLQETAWDMGIEDWVEWSWPLPNVWLGVSAEDQERADERIPILLDTPAAVRFVSAEPLLGPVVLDKAWGHPRSLWDDDTRTLVDGWHSALGGKCCCCGNTGDAPPETQPACGHVYCHICWGRDHNDDPPECPGPPPRLDWVIVGGESGPGYREMDPAWALSLRQQCQAAGVALHEKQASGARSGMPYPNDLQPMVREWPGEEAQDD